ncbi:hypothetical protein Cob_v008346 [Colletotrichum orbiculare MAFF 240422]|uniref:Uncharacterized protein n=1 Tax=Colletotrichum orbiculare (strain 104-T / ATCC 96160 / CBS 514.97 / LARS 414 / MAFF 240422) TaxID=1213857 RepID=N4VH78_COLOR|nr:hypothetical protein Cob_v008346 [Colletotrichum orbiculare MAFF 240422]
MAPESLTARTLEELPTHLSSYGYHRDPFARTCLSMISTGIHTWGFVIYRCTYDDDELWDRYLAQLKSLCHDELVNDKRAELLEPHLDWVVVEDPATLDNASRFQVRKHFNQWVAEQNVPLHAAKNYINCFPIQLPRFRYCLYVDKQCLETVIQFQEANDGTKMFISTLPPLVFAVVDRIWTPNGTEDPFDVFEAVEKEKADAKKHGDGEQDDEEEEDDDDEDEEEEEEYEYVDEEEEYDRGYPLVDGSDRRYVGWMYCNAWCVAGIYEMLHNTDGLDDYGSYLRPPGIWPGKDRSMPT